MDEGKKARTPFSDDSVEESTKPTIRSRERVFVAPRRSPIRRWPTPPGHGAAGKARGASSYFDTSEKTLDMESSDTESSDMERSTSTSYLFVGGDGASLGTPAGTTRRHLGMLPLPGPVADPVTPPSGSSPVTVVFDQGGRPSSAESWREASTRARRHAAGTMAPATAELPRVGDSRLPGLLLGFALGVALSVIVWLVTV